MTGSPAIADTDRDDLSRGIGRKGKVGILTIGARDGLEDDVTEAVAQGGTANRGRDTRDTGGQNTRLLRRC